jgi:hypothetical protein
LYCPVPDVQTSLDHGGEDRKVVDNVIAGQIQAPQLSELKQKKQSQHFGTKIPLVLAKWKGSLQIAASRYFQKRFFLN